MTGLNKRTSTWLVRTVGVCAVLATIAFTGGRVVAQDGYQPWVAPNAARAVKNPFPANPQNIAAGKAAYMDNCVLCHGDKGRGDGIAGKTGNIPPTNFTDEKVMAKETDGSLFWMLSEGRGLMPTGKAILSEKQRWQLVDYIRKLTNGASTK
jgi:mono/diheme cytochrome c family protein